MKHTNQPATVYDLTVLASTLARHNVRAFDHETSVQLAEVHQAALALLRNESSHKPPVPHTDPELLNGARGFTDAILQLLHSAQDQDRIAARVAEQTRFAIARFVDSLKLLEKNPPRWLCDPIEIDRMFGIDVTTESAKAAMAEEMVRFSASSSPNAPHSIQASVTEGETQRLFASVRKNLFKAEEIDPQLYIEAMPEKHYLFWTSTADRQECAVPSSYSLAEYLRFHCPHNDAHLSHLHDLSSHGVSAYTDCMDERAFFEAVAVLSEWQILQALTANDEDLVTSLHTALEPDRRNQIAPETLRRWMIEIRTYECRLRAARLVADVLTIDERLPFEEMVKRSMAITGLDPKDAEAEARKYYFLTGLGATYTLGYKKMLKSGIRNATDGFNGGVTTLRTWHQFDTYHGS